MMPDSKTLRIDLAIICLILFAPAWAKGQTSTEAKKADFYDVVASPKGYDGQLLSVKAILWPGDHALSLYGSACVPKEGYNVTTEALLPPGWESLPNGKKLKAILKRHRSAMVEVVGIFESGGGPYGPDGTRFRFTISQVNSASKDTAETSGG